MPATNNPVYTVEEEEEVNYFLLTLSTTPKSVVLKVNKLAVKSKDEGR